MTADFEKIIDRKNTWSIKWDYNEKFFGQKDVLPMWVADMDFPSPAAVAEAVKKRAEHGLFGYTGIPESYIDDKIPKVKIIIPEGTYLVWLDCRELGMDSGSLKNFFIKQARVGLNDGIIFGKDGAGFQRMNIACPRPLLLDGLQRIESACSELGAGDEK